MVDDTIAAISTPIGTGGISIIRVSGRNALSIGDQIFRSKTEISRSISHTLQFGKIVDPATSEVIDYCIVSAMHAPRTYTGEDCIEINCHGGVINAERILNLVISKGARLAEPGEFTKMAFLNGKIDLSQVEAVSDIISAKTEGARKAALSQYSGNLKTEIAQLRAKLLHVCSLLELDLDFAEENLIDINSSITIDAIEVVEGQINKLLATYETGHLIRDGAKIVIAGKPNVGKSSLLNSFLGRNRAIVSETPGTTRDFIEESMDIYGIPFSFVDTAGIRKSVDNIESVGISISKELVENSDLVLAVFDISRRPDAEDIGFMKMLDTIGQKRIIYLYNKIDETTNFESEFDLPAIRISAKHNLGIDDIKSRIKELFLSDTSYTSPMISRLHHKDSLEKSLNSLYLAKTSAKEKRSNEFVSIDIKNAVNHLCELTGQITSNDVLNNIFSNFCIGK